MVENLSWKLSESNKQPSKFLPLISATTWLVFAITSQTVFAQNTEKISFGHSYNDIHLDIHNFTHHDNTNILLDFWDETISTQQLESRQWQQSIMFHSDREEPSEEISWDMEPRIEINMNNLCDKKGYKLKVNEWWKHYIEADDWDMAKALAKNADCKWGIVDWVKSLMPKKQEEDTEEDIIKHPKKKNKVLEFVLNGFRYKNKKILE